MSGTHVRCYEVYQQRRRPEFSINQHQHRAYSADFTTSSNFRSFVPGSFNFACDVTSDV